MKTLLVMLIEKINPPWWRLRTVFMHDPCNVREGDYVLSLLLQIVRSKLKHVEKENAKVDP